MPNDIKSYILEIRNPFLVEPNCPEVWHDIVQHDRNANVNKRLSARLRRNIPLAMLYPSVPVNFP
jgi:hypothetical protein